MTKKLALATGPPAGGNFNVCFMGHMAFPSWVRLDYAAKPIAPELVATTPKGFKTYPATNPAAAMADLAVALGVIRGQALAWAQGDNISDDDYQSLGLDADPVARWARESGQMAGFLRHDISWLGYVRGYEHKKDPPEDLFGFDRHHVFEFSGGRKLLWAFGPFGDWGFFWLGDREIDIWAAEAKPK